MGLPGVANSYPAQQLFIMLAGTLGSSCQRIRPILWLTSDANCCRFMPSHPPAVSIRRGVVAGLRCAQMAPFGAGVRPALPP
jgi:hypothetical protein